MASLRSCLALSFALAAASLAPAYAEDAPKSSATVVDLENATCPVKGTPALAEISETHGGMKVHFCCIKCAAKFKADPTPYIARLREDPVVAKKMDAVEKGSAGTATSGKAGVLVEKDVPKAVRDALAARYAGATVARWEQDEEDGKAVFEAKVNVATKDKDGREVKRQVEVTLAADGSLVEEEEDLREDQLPEVVRKALAASKHAKATFRKIERSVTAGAEDSPRYELRLAHGGKVHDVHFDKAGKIVKDEEEDDDDSDDEDDDD